MNPIILPWPPKILGGNGRGHWAAKHKAVKAARAEAAKATLAAGCKLSNPVTVYLHVKFIPPGNYNYDDDNLIHRFKAYRDGIADALRLDDFHFKTIPELCQSEGKPGRMEVLVTEVER